MLQVGGISAINLHSVADCRDTPIPPGVTFRGNCNKLKRRTAHYTSHQHSFSISRRFHLITMFPILFSLISVFALINISVVTSQPSRGRSISSDNQSPAMFLHARQACLVQCSPTTCCNTGGPCIPGGCCPASESPCPDGFGCCPDGVACITEADGTPACNITVLCSTQCDTICCDPGYVCSQLHGEPICTQPGPLPHPVTSTAGSGNTTESSSKTSKSATLATSASSVATTATGSSSVSGSLISSSTPSAIQSFSNTLSTSPTITTIVVPTSDASILSSHQIRILYFLGVLGGVLLAFV